jgi:hypothetical protein
MKITIQNNSFNRCPLFEAIDGNLGTLPWHF